MNHNEYRGLTGPLLDQAHDLSMALYAAAKLLPSTASVEYNDLSRAAHLVNLAADTLYGARWPRPSALTDSEPVNA